ncbi:uncharacterized protein M421DRAFT_426527 [Didymella exigua CBS 183.55]|uniref:Tyrosine specific protein phosphatases domain-containing protein n=1 Tax=Didymella exigua CBS 183.55 TaxID=1150837 RepID=A0A6A5R7U9_9PLEO|nr:uncharacterized protein M421DRAFT_426527 [Didymella exigua CBS 183.55]KAF1922786.1 hypothetical protein M421DRAFT_426527 [Didymella exigua CBS 183.55]
MAQTPLPSPPFFTIPNIANFRDASITLQTPHGPIRERILFRSAEVSKLDRAGWDAVRALGVAHVFDLRSKPEVEKGWSGIVASAPGAPKDVRLRWMVGMEDSGVQRTWVPVFREQDYGPAALAERYQKYMHKSTEGFVAAYRDILKSGASAYRTMFLYLAGLDPVEVDDGKRRGALIHCTAGKDRTGVFFGILFDFLGVSREQIAAEYNLTEPGLAVIREVVVARLLQSPGFQRYMLSLSQGEMLSQEQFAKSVENRNVADAEPVVFGPEVMEEGRQAALRMAGARKESMLATLEMVDREFGGSERYMREYCGLVDRELEGLRRVCVVSSTG